MPANESTIIPDEHLAWLRIAIGESSDNFDCELPKKLLEKYWEFKQIAERFGSGLIPRDIVAIAFLAGFGKPTEKEKEPPTVLELWKKAKVKAGADVLVKWKGKTHEGKLLGFNGAAKPLVSFAGEERAVDVADVSVPERELAGA